MDGSLRKPPLAPRVLVALLLGAAFAGAIYLYTRRLSYLGGHDFGFLWRAARALLSGQDPYALDPFASYGKGGPMVYPAPTIILAAPFGLVDPFVSSALFFGLSTSVLAFALTQSGWWRLAVLATPGMLYASVSVNFPPLLTASALLPSLGWLAVLKPNLGIVTFAYRPQWRSVALGIAALGLSFLVLPGWPQGWWYQMHALDVPVYRQPITLPFGVLGLLGLLRWRTAEGRALAAFTLIPIGLFPYDYLLLWLIPRTWREYAVLTVPAWLVMPAALGASMRSGPTELLITESILQLGMLVPAVFIVLRRPNTGAMPAFIERAASRLPTRIRGTAELR